MTLKFYNNPNIFMRFLVQIDEQTDLRTDILNITELFLENVKMCVIFLCFKSYL